MTAGWLLVLPRSLVLFADGRYALAAEQGARKGIAVRPLENLGKALAVLPECGFEDEDVTVARLGRWKSKFPSTKFVRTSEVVEHFRRTKSDDELRVLMRARRMTQELLRRVPSSLRAGVNERAIAWKLEVWARDLGAEGLSFPPIVAFGSHTSSPHHQPTSRPLRKGHVVQVDVGVKFRGYCGDLSDIYFTAKPKSEEQAVFDAVREAKEKAQDAVQAGVTTTALDRIARGVLKKAGYDAFFTHSLGHGVGLDIHEGVSLSSQRKPVELLKNEVITIEPGVYLPGKFGIRLEDMVVV
jgi:Xaa-Pro aminopeptidase